MRRREPTYLLFSRRIRYAFGEVKAEMASIDHVLITGDGKKVVVNMDRDICLFDAPENPPNTGTKYTSGTDLYAHKARSGNVYFYTYAWSMWQGVESRIELVDEGKARAFLLRCAGNSGWDVLSESERKRAQEYFPNIFEEDA